MLEKEWLYTLRNGKSIALAIVAPGLLAVFAARALSSKSAGAGLYYAMWLPLIAATFRGVDRVRREGVMGTGVIYLRTQTSPAKLIQAKWLLEWAITTISLFVPIASALSFGRGRIHVVAILELLPVAALTSGLALLLSCLATSPETYSALVFILSLPMVILTPGLTTLPATLGRVIVIYPPLLVASIARQIAMSGSAHISLVLAATAEISVILAVSGDAYRKLLIRTLV